MLKHVLFFCVYSKFPFDLMPLMSVICPKWPPGQPLPSTLSKNNKQMRIHLQISKGKLYVKSLMSSLALGGKGMVQTEVLMPNKRNWNAS